MNNKIEVVATYIYAHTATYVLCDRLDFLKLPIANECILGL